MNADLDAQIWPGTGRLVRVQMYGLTVREMTGRSVGEPFLDRIARADLDAFAQSADPPDLLCYVELALRGGFPDALSTIWFYLQFQIELDTPLNPRR